MALHPVRSNALYQLFSRPDRYLGLCGRLDCEVSEWHIPGAPDFMRGVRVLFAADFHVTRRTSDGDIDALLRKIEGTKLIVGKGGTL